MPSTAVIILLIAVFIGLALPALIKFFLLYIRLPLKGYGKPLVGGKSSFVLVPLKSLSPAQQQVAERIGERFALSGFRIAGVVTREGLVENQRAVQLCFDNPDTGEIAVLIMIAGPHSQNHSLSVRSTLSEDESINTAGWQATGVLPRDAKAHGVVCRWVRDPAVLVELHRRRLARWPTPVPRQLPYPPGGLLSFIEQQNGKSIQRFDEYGYGKLEPATQICRKTLKGTFLMTWKLLPPWRGIRQGRINREARRVWREMNMDAYTPPPESIATAAVASSTETSLDYGVRLPPGEITRERRGPLLVVRVGNPSIGQVLLSQWMNLISFVFFGGICAFQLYLWWEWRNVPRYLGRQPLTSMFAVVVAILLWDVWLIVAAVRKVRGTTTITAGPAGIDFHNVPDRQRDGHLSREDVFGLHAHVADSRLGRKCFALSVSTVGDRRRIRLLQTTDANAAEQLRLAIRNALQLDPDISPADAKA